MTSPTPYQLLPRLSDEEYEALKNDIAENGVRVPIDVDENGTILDGHHRAWITADLNIDCPRRVVTGLSEEQKRTHAVAVNVHRRSLTREQRNAVIVKLRAEGMTQPKIAEATGVSLGTVNSVVRQANFSSENGPHAPTITNALGQQRPATYERRQQPDSQPEPPSDTDLFAGEDWVQPGSSEPERTAPPPPSPLDDFTNNERDLHKQLAAGETVVVSMRHHQRLIAWADARGLYERIDRRGPWGNPFELPADGDRDTVIRNYEQHYLPYKPSLLDRLHELKGKALGCWCAPEPCHGDVLKNGADEL